MIIFVVNLCGFCVYNGQSGKLIEINKNRDRKWYYEARGK